MKTFEKGAGLIWFAMNAADPAKHLAFPTTQVKSMAFRSTKAGATP
ncbi:hypothetical protein [Sulfitobacter sp. SK011]|nr:hypothetical protein [Sulfitobacter sp. SK011]